MIRLNPLFYQFQIFFVGPDACTLHVAVGLGRSGRFQHAGCVERPRDSAVLAALGKGMLGCNACPGMCSRRMMSTRARQVCVHSCIGHAGLLLLVHSSQIRSRIKPTHFRKACSSVSSSLPIQLRSSHTKDCAVSPLIGSFSTRFQTFCCSSSQV